MIGDQWKRWVIERREKVYTRRWSWSPFSKKNCLYKTRTNYRQNKSYPFGIKEREFIFQIKEATLIQESMHLSWSYLKRREKSKLMGETCNLLERDKIVKDHERREWDRWGRERGEMERLCLERGDREIETSVEAWEKIRAYFRVGPRLNVCYVGGLQNLGA